MNKKQKKSLKRKGLRRKRVLKHKDNNAAVNNILSGARAKEIGVPLRLHKLFMDKGWSGMTREEQEEYVLAYGEYQKKMINYKKASKGKRIKNYISDAYAKFRR